MWVCLFDSATHTDNCSTLPTGLNIDQALIAFHGYYQPQYFFSFFLDQSSSLPSQKASQSTGNSLRGPLPTRMPLLHTIERGLFNVCSLLNLCNSDIPNLSDSNGCSLHDLYMSPVDCNSTLCLCCYEQLCRDP